MRDEIRMLMVALIVLLGTTAAWAQTTREDSLKLSDAYFDISNNEYEPGRLESALAYSDSALLYNPESAKAWQLKASTLARMNRHEAAQLAFDEALRLKPDYKTAWWHRGCDNAVAGRVIEALSDLERAIALDSTVKSWPFQDDCWKNLRDNSALLKLTAPYTMENAR